MKTKTYSSVKNYITPLNEILQNNKTAIDEVSSSLQIRGYAFVRIPKKLVDQIDACLPLIENFFNEQESYKKKYFKEPIFGYFNAGHKESFRLLTGVRLKEHNIPLTLEKIKELTRTVDQLMYVKNMFKNLKHILNLDR